MIQPPKEHEQSEAGCVFIWEVNSWVYFYIDLMLNKKTEKICMNFVTCISLVTLPAFVIFVCGVDISHTISFDYAYPQVLCSVLLLYCHLESGSSLFGDTKTMFTA